MFEHHIKAADLSTVLKVKSYEQRLIIKEIYHIQQEIKKNNNWIYSYNKDPVPHLKGVAEKIENQLQQLEADEKDRISRLDDDIRSELRQITESSIY
ncbi:hypothetical protein ACFL96_11035 [Thermoproteota archaeon]